MSSKQTYMSLILVALILIGAAFYLGLTYTKEPVLIQVPVSNQTNGLPPVASSTSVTNAPQVIDPFKPETSLGSEPHTLGTFGTDAFILYAPDWFAHNWSSFTQDGLYYEFSPNGGTQNDFSSIELLIQSSTEEYNALTLYEADKALTANLIIAETLLNTAGTMPIYHVQRTQNDRTWDYFYFDGAERTGVVKFSALTDSYPKYGAKIRELVEGFDKVALPQD